MLGRIATGSRRLAGCQFVEVEVVIEIRVGAENEVVFGSEIGVVNGIVDSWCCFANWMR